MNCEAYKEAIAADPAFDGGAGHLSECAACRAYRREMLDLDRQIGRALAIDVPSLQLPDLPEPGAVESGNVVALPKRRTPALWLALAATVVLAVFVSVRLTGIGDNHDSLAEQLLAHMDHEPYAIRITDVPVPDERLQSVVPADVARLDRRVGLITYAQSCRINGREVPHLVMQGEHGPITILLMPHEMVDGPQSLTGDSVNGVILPVGDGSIAIFGEREEALDLVEKKVRKSVSWST